MRTYYYKAFGTSKYRQYCKNVAASSMKDAELKFLIAQPEVIKTGTIYRITKQQFDREAKS